MKMTYSLMSGLLARGLFALFILSSCETKDVHEISINDSIQSSTPHEASSNFDTLKTPFRAVKTHPYLSSRPLVASTRDASPLVRGVLHQLKGGEPRIFKLAFNVDDALRAAQDHVVIGAFYLQSQAQYDLKTFKRVSQSHAQGSLKDHGEHALVPRDDHHKLTSLSPLYYRVASSQLWWAHRGAKQEISAQMWSELISGARERWPNGELFQLCLRAGPDPLEELWRHSYPKLANTLKRARSLGRWPVFQDDEALLSYVTTHPGALAIFSVGNLKLHGAPLSQVMIKEAPAPHVILSLYLHPFERIKEAYQNISLVKLAALKSQLNDLRSALSDQERPSVVREWGWEP